jgi:hypothetical protein
MLFEHTQDAAAGKRKIKIKAGNLVPAQVVEFVSFQLAKRHRSIQIVVNAQGTLELQHFIGNARSLRAEARNDYNV